MQTNSNRFIRKLKVWAALERREKYIMWRGLFYLLRAWLRVSFLSKKIRQEVAPPHAFSSSFEGSTVNRCVKAISRLSNHFWLEPSCLVKAVALRDLLRFCDEDAEVRLLVRRHEGGNFEFHSVVCREGEIIFGDNGEWASAVSLKPTERNLC